MKYYLIDGTNETILGSFSSQAEAEKAAKEFYQLLVDIGDEDADWSQDDVGNLMISFNLRIEKLSKKDADYEYAAMTKQESKYYDYNFNN